MVFLLSLYSGAAQAQDNKQQIVFVKQLNSGFLSSEGVHFELSEERQVRQIFATVLVTQKAEPTKPMPTPTLRLNVSEANKSISKKESNVQPETATASDNTFFIALNNYRKKNGKPALSWDTKLASYAQSRAELFASSEGLDNHAGFNDFITNQDGFSKLGFYALGENSGFGHTADAASVIENSYGSSPSHNENQLNGNWSHVGIGVKGTATNFVFGGRKI